MLQLHDPIRHVFDHIFFVDWTTWYYSDRRFVNDQARVYVLLQCARLFDGSRVHSDDVWTSLYAFSEARPRAPAADCEDDEPMSDALPERLVWLDHPWMIQDWQNVEASEVTSV